MTNKTIPQNVQKHIVIITKMLGCSTKYPPSPPPPLAPSKLWVPAKSDIYKRRVVKAKIQKTSVSGTVNLFEKTSTVFTHLANANTLSVIGVCARVAVYTKQNTETTGTNMIRFDTKSILHARNAKVLRSLSARSLALSLTHIKTNLPSKKERSCNRLST